MHKCKSTVVENSYDLQGGWGLAALALASYIGPFDIRCGGGGSWQKYQLVSKRHTILGASVRGKWRDCRFLKPVHIFVCTASFASARILLQMDDHLVRSLWLAPLKTGISSTTLCLHWPLHQQQQSKFGHLFRTLLAESCKKANVQSHHQDLELQNRHHTPSEPQVLIWFQKTWHFVWEQQQQAASPFVLVFCHLCTFE